MNKKEKLNQTTSDAIDNKQLQMYEYTQQVCSKHSGININIVAYIPKGQDKQ